jgi:calcium-dependent secretion activator
LGIFEKWYSEQINLICAWLSERLDISLHPYQLACLSLIVKKIRNNYELQGVQEKILDSKTFLSVNNRLTVEETNQTLR